MTYFVIFGGCVFQQTIDIPMDIYFAPLFDNFYSYEAYFMQGLLEEYIPLYRLCSFTEWF